jgi:hypothetical protein
MAKTKTELLKEAQTAGLVAAEADPDDFKAADLEAIVSGEIPVRERQSATNPIVAADGHVVLSQEDIDARNA